MPRASAPKAPATRDQVDAYRFGLRRLEAALVRGDPVPLHEQIRSQRRAAMAGALLGMLAMGGVAIFALISPKPDWTRQAVVVGRESGSMYVVAHEPDRLVPVANLTAGRLVLAALRSGGATGAEPASAVPVVVPDAELGGAPRTATAAVAGAEGVRLDAPGIPPRWAVCDQTSGGAVGRADLVGTTVVAGAAPATPMAAGDGILVAVAGGSTWLITDGRRHEVDLDDAIVLASLGLTDRAARPASAATVSALPEGPRLQAPAIPDVGSPGPRGLRERVGEVLITRPVGGEQRHYVVLANGMQEVSPVLAGVIRRATGSGEPREVDAVDVAQVPVVSRLDVGGWPAAAPRLLDVRTAPVLCWAWSGEPGAAPAGTVLAGSALPAPERGVTVQLAQADGAGERVDAVVLDPQGSGAVRATSPGSAPGAGAMYLISATGVAYRVTDDETAQLLGATSAPPAPGAVLARLLPNGPTLDLAEARQAVDVLVPDA